MKKTKAAPAKKKAGTAAKKKPLAATKKKTASAPKKRVAAAVKTGKPTAPARKKPASLAAQKLELHKQAVEFVKAAFNGKRMAYFVHDIERKEGAYVMCIAIEGESGYYCLEWGWHCSFAKAKAETALMNKKLGLSEEDVNDIIISTMGPPKRQSKKRR